MMWWLCSARMGRGGSVDRLFGSGRCRSEQQPQRYGLLLVWGDEEDGERGVVFLLKVLCWGFAGKRCD